MTATLNQARASVSRSLGTLRHVCSLIDAAGSHHAQEGLVGLGVVVDETQVMWGMVVTLTGHRPDPQDATNLA